MTENSLQDPRTGWARSPRLSSSARKRVLRRLYQTSYRLDPNTCYVVACLFPGFAVFPSSFGLPLAGALTMLRLGVFLGAFAAFRELARKLAQGGFVLIMSDLLVPAMSIWMIATVLLHQGTAGLAGYGAVSAYEFWFAYLIGRTFFGTPAGYAQFVRVMKVVVAAILISALMDTATGKHIVSITGAALSRAASTDSSTAYRFGLVRAQGSLEHPILLGVFGTVATIIFYHSRLSQIQKGIWCALSTFMALLALSSAAFLSLILFVVAAGFGFVFRGHAWKWKALAMAAVIALLTLVLVVDHPLETLIKNLTLDPQTGLFRLQIWQWVGMNIRNSPWIGIGFDDWQRPDFMPASIDSLWLIQSVRFGIPALAMLAGAILTTGFALPLRAQKGVDHHPFATEAQTGLGIAILVYSFNAFTVHFWGTNWMFLGAILGMRAGFTESFYLTPFARADDAMDEAVNKSMLSRTVKRLMPKLPRARVKPRHQNARG